MASSLLLVCAVWTVLVAGHIASHWLGHDNGALLALAAATALVIATRPLRPSLPRAGPVCLGIAAGYASYPAWIGTVAAIGLAAGLEPAAATPPGRGGPALWIGAVVLAPVFEELLYRERLLPALRAKLGTAAALVAASALFAIPHGETWSVLGTLLVGWMLGWVLLVGGSIGLCISLHAGLNLAALTGGLPPTRLALPPFTAAAVGSALLVTALERLRGPRNFPRPLASAAPPGGSS